MKSGIYSILNTLNSKIYIGSANDIDRRLSEHLRQLRNNKHPNIKIQNSWNKYSEENFIFNIIEYSDVENLLIREQYYLDTYLDANLDTITFEKNGYNILRIAGSSRGHKMSVETKNKISISLTGEKNPFYGKTHNDETKKIMSIKKSGENNPNYGKEGPMSGKKHNDETRKLMSISSSGSNNKNSKKVFQYTKDYNLVREWDSTGQVAKVLNISQGNISTCCLGKQKTAYGFIWSYNKICT
jgi:group I intron endonuclease